MTYTLIFNKFPFPLVILILLHNTSILAQEPLKKRKALKEIETLYNFGHIGNNISINYTHYLGQHAITGGLKYHLETEIKNKNSRFDGWTFYRPSPRYGQRTGQKSSSNKPNLSPIVARTGLTLGYKYALNRTSQTSSLKPYVFYQLQLTFQMPATLFPVGPSYYLSPSFFVWENNFGVGIHPKIYKRLSGDASIGAGATRFSSDVEGFWERSFVIRLGLAFQIDNSQADD